MNAAFRRGEAITRLENYACVILEHLALATWFPEHSARNHWDIELKAFNIGLTRYNKGKGRKPNYTTTIIVDTLTDFIETNDEKDYLLVDIESHGVKAPENPDWKALKHAINSFAEDVVANATQ